MAGRTRRADGAGRAARSSGRGRRGRRRSATRRRLTVVGDDAGHRAGEPHRRTAPASRRSRLMRALVTGGAGFIGSTLVDRLLAEGHAVDVVDDLSTGTLANLADAAAPAGPRRSRSTTSTSASPSVVELIGRRQPEVVFHLAAQADVRVSVARPVFDAEVNVLGSLNVLEAPAGGGQPQGRVRRRAAARSTATSTPRPPGQRVAIRSGRSRPTAWPRRSSATTSPRTASCTSSSSPRWRWPTCTAPARTRTARPASSRSSPGACWPASRARSSATATQTRDFVFVDDVVDAFVRAASTGRRAAGQHRHRRRDLGQRAVRTGAWPRAAGVHARRPAPLPAGAAPGELQPLEP